MWVILKMSLEQSKLINVGVIIYDSDSVWVYVCSRVNRFISLFLSVTAVSAGRPFTLAC